MRAITRFTASVLIALGLAHATDPETSLAQSRPLAFEVVSVKPNSSGEPGGTSRAQPGRYQGINVTLRRVIALAYRPVQEFVGGPDWIAAARFDIEARTDATATPDQMLEMLRTLLADRFKLVVHRESRSLPVYALTLDRRDGRLGKQLRQSSADCASRGAAQPPPATSEQQPRCGFRLGNGALSGVGATMTQLAAEMSFVGRQVVDRTGLTGLFDIDLEWTPDPAGATAPPPDAGPSIFTAVQEQLGLKLEPATAPIDVIVIDSAEPPQPN